MTSLQLVALLAVALLGVGLKLYGGDVWTEVSRFAHSAAGCWLAGFLLVVAILGVGLKLYGSFRRRQRRQRWSRAGKDMVVLHQFERATNTPNLSPYALKLETFLRMANIQYVVDTEEPQGARNKCPWITINGVELSDSELIIDYLTKHFNNPVPMQLTPAQHAIGRAVQVMLDEHTFMAVANKRYLLDKMKYVMNWFPQKYKSWYWSCLMKFVYLPMVRKWSYFQGIGRFNNEETLFFLYRHLSALEGVLGDKPFLVAATPSTYDAAAFAELTQVTYGCAPEVERYVRDRHGALVQYHERMKAKYWPDWDQCRAE